MELHLETDPHFFLQNVSKTLEKEPALHSFILSLTARHVEIQKPMTLLARGLRDQSLQAAGIQTESDRVLILSAAEPLEAEKFADLLSKRVESLPGVNGPVSSADAFARKWVENKQQSLRLTKSLRLFELTSLRNPPFPHGQARVAKAEDQNLILDWIQSFNSEALPDEPAANQEILAKSIGSGIKNGNYYLWENGDSVVSLVGSTRETLTERWIAPVYTPPHLRGQGYGTALTAFVSEKILATGKKAVLFTDLSNPASNHIYQKIGYRMVADFKNYLFE